MIHRFALVCIAAAWLAAADPVAPPVGPATPAAIALAGPWKARLVHALPPAGSVAASHRIPPISAEAQLVVLPGVDDGAWATVRLPSPFSAAFGPEWADTDGEAVFRRSIDIPAAWAGLDLDLSLGAIDDCDDTYVNGVRVGGIGPTVPGSWAKVRRFRVPGRLVKPGPMLLAVRVFDCFSGGGFMSQPADLWLRPAVVAGVSAPAR